MTAKKTIKKAAPKKKASPKKKIAAKKKRVVKKKKVVAKEVSDKCTDKEELFCQQYIIDFNKTLAAKRAKFGTTDNSSAVMGCKLYKKPRVQERIHELMIEKMADVNLSQNDVFRHWADMLQFDIRGLYHADDRLKKPHELTRQQARVVTGFKYMEQFEGVGKDRIYIGDMVEVKLANVQPAIHDLATHLNMLRPTVTLEAGSSLRELLNEIDGDGLTLPSQRGGPKESK